MQDLTMFQGRGHECDIRITDISVSRFHACLKLKKNEFWIEDYTSKFGSLIGVTEPVEIHPLHKMKGELPLAL
jgi:hypothetical protein